MHRLMLRGPLAFLAILAVVLGTAAEAQRLPQHARAFVPSPQVLARGGTGVAIPGAETALFYNPAHLARVGFERPRIEIFSLQGDISSNFIGNVTFARKELQEAIGDGIDLPLTQEQRDLFDEVLERGRRPTVGAAAVTLPSVMLTLGDVGVAGGIFGTNVTRLRFDDIGGGIPRADLFSQADIIVAGGAGVAIPQTPIAAGATVRFARRFLTSKRKNLLQIDPDREQLYIFGGTTLAIDLGVHASDVLTMIPGRLDFGLVVYDLVGGGFGYSHDGSIELTGEGPEDQREISRILASLEDRDGAMSVRAGAAYFLPVVGPLEDFVVALDWYSRSTSESTQPAIAGLHLGAEARVAGPLTVRAGFGQGYPSLGLGLNVGFAHLDYSLYGVEEGRLPGQLQRYAHLVRVRLGLF